MKKWVRFLPLGLGGLALILLIGRHWQRGDVRLQTVRSHPQHDRIQVYMNHNSSHAYMDPYRNFRRTGDNLEQQIIEQIQSAQVSVAVAVQELRSPKIAAALQDRHRAGLDVRVILENSYSRPWSSFSASEINQFEPRYRQRYQDGFALIDQNQNQQLEPNEIKTFDALVIIQNAGIPWLDDTADGSAGSGLMHHKFVIIDDHTTLVTTANFTLSGLHGDLHNPDSRGNANSLVILKSSPLTAAFQQEFDYLWGDGPGDAPDSTFGVNKPYRLPQTFSLADATVQVQFSPTSKTYPWTSSTNGLIGRTLLRATQQIDLALFVFSEQQLANQLEAHPQQVAIRALIDPSFAFKSYSEALDMLGVAAPQINRQTQTCTYEANNQPWQHPLQTVGVAQLPPGDRLHHKYGVLDQKIVIVGSHNWSNAANTLNDETLLVIEHPTVAAHYHREFERLYATSRLGLPDTWQQRHPLPCHPAPQNSAAPVPSAAPLPPIEQVEAPDKLETPASRGPINLNTASQSELESIPGIGPTLATRMIAARQQAPFMTWEDVDQISGIGPQLMETLTESATLSRP